MRRTPSFLSAVCLAPCLAVLCLASCQSGTATDARPPLAGAKIGGPFALIDENGRPVTDRSFAGKYRVMYFGYTYCPDVCPVDVQTIAQGLAELEKRDPALAARVVPIFVTVDPARDTPAVLKQFTAAFSPRLVGLTGSPQAVAQAEKAYAVYASKGLASPGGYLVNHSRQTYLMDPDNRPLALVPQDETPAAVADTIEKWAK
ncbi:SCO family protein [Sphingomonas cynarae]